MLGLVTPNTFLGIDLYAINVCSFGLLFTIFHLNENKIISISNQTTCKYNHIKYNVKTTFLKKKNSHI